MQRLLCIVIFVAATAVAVVVVVAVVVAIIANYGSIEPRSTSHQPITWFIELYEVGND